MFVFTCLDWISFVFVFTITYNLTSGCKYFLQCGTANLAQTQAYFTAEMTDQSWGKWTPDRKFKFCFTNSLLTKI